MNRTFTVGLCLLSCSIQVAVAAIDQPQTTATAPLAQIAAQPLEAALTSFSRQSGLQVIYASDLVAGRRSGEAPTGLPPAEALKRILSGTGLTFSWVNNRTVSIWEEGEQSLDNKTGANAGIDRDLHLARVETDPSSAMPEGKVDQYQPGEEDKNNSSASAEETNDGLVSSRGGIPEILVKGAKLLNIDIPRSRDDTQPYVIFTRDTIEQSGSANLEDFLKQRLTMNTVGRSNGQANSTQGSSSTVNLRGLGSNQTLILIDGRRPAPINSNSGSLAQTNLNGIPLAAVERVEVLPSTASGIYGGSATGGVVNIVLRRDYSGAEMKVTYENTFESDATRKRVDFGAGFALENGRTDVMLAGSYSDDNHLLFQERQFYERGVSAILANTNNNYEAFNLGSGPPGGATPNIRSANGSNLTLKSGGIALNSPITFVPSGYAGIDDGGAALVANAGAYNLNLASSAQNSFGSQLSLLSQPTTKSLMATLRREFTPRIQVFLDLAGSDVESRYRSNSLRSDYFIPTSVATNPFEQDIRISLPLAYVHPDQRVEYSERRAATGVIFQLPAGWHAETDYTWSRSTKSFFSPGGRLSTLGASISNGTLDVLRDLDQLPIAVESFVGPDQFNTPQDYTLKDATLRASGPLGLLPGGAPVVSASLSRRDERLSDGILHNIIPSLSFYFPTQSQETHSAYAEIKLPIVGARNSVAGIRELELQLAGRHDDYTMHSATGSIVLGSNEVVERSVNKKSSTNPTVGLRYRPLADLLLRGSYGTGFLPPSFSQILATPTSVTVNVVDPLRGNTLSAVPPGPNSIQGGNPNVQPESSESRSAGFVLTPQAIPELRLSFDWTRIEKTDNIVRLSHQQIVDHEASLSGRVMRGARLDGDPAEWAGPIVAIDRTLVNLAQAYVEAYDVAVDYAIEPAGAGMFEIYALATWQTHLKTKILPTDAFSEQVGVTASNPLKFKANVGVNWSRHNVTLGWAASYFGSYHVADPSAGSSASVFVQQGSHKVSSQSYHDAFAIYRFSAGESVGKRILSLLRDTELNVGIKNIFDSAPPFDVSQSSIGYYSPFGDPLMRRYHISLQRAF